MKTSAEQIEILAPVGGREQLTAAVRSGADAVYFGMQNFNARRNAENFNQDALGEMIGYCHVRGVRVYLTLNTLVTDPEIPEVRRAVDAAAEAGADALIIQDMAVAEYARREWPGLKRFASTQMAVHNAEGARFLAERGFERIVLARELSLREIKKIIRESGARCEVFVHGAHCMSVSGNCYLSAMIGGRSGNRGLCAQPCRLDWQRDGRHHVLSLKDLSYIQHISELREAGVSSLKIEGRMKRAEYVAAAVTACRLARDGQKPDMETLRAVFSRTGFTDGYLTGKLDRDMFGHRTKEDVLAAGQVLSGLKQLYRNERQSVPVTMCFTAKSGVPCILSVSDGEHEVEVRGEIPEPAKTAPLSVESVERNLEKTGGTPYRALWTDCNLEDGLMIPFGQLNRMRRDALDQMTLKRAEIKGYSRMFSKEPIGTERCAPDSPRLRLRFESAEQIFSVPEDSDMILPLEEIAKNQDLIGRFGGRLFAEIPAVLWPGSAEKADRMLRDLSERGLKHAVCSNVGAIQIACDKGLVLHGGMELNVLNSVSLQEYGKAGLADATVSFELAMHQIRNLRGFLPHGIIAYGRVPLMKFRNCPGKSDSGCGNCPGKSFLTDRLNERFPLLCRDRQYSELLNCVPLYIGDKKRPAVDFETLYFTVESSRECEDILKIYKQACSPDFRRTNGLYYRELL